MTEMPQLLIKDVTLREGTQAAPVSLSIDEKVEIARALDDAGVDIVQAGWAGREDEHVRRVRAACPSLMIEALLTAWDPVAKTSLASALEAGANMCGVVMRSSDGHLAAAGQTREQALELVRDVVGEAKRIGYENIRLALSYASQADPAFRMTLYECGLEAGATAISYADSTGTNTPAMVREAIAEIAEAFPGVTINSHTHNDFGLAVANTLASVEGGATMLDVTVNGLGDRAGNSALAETVMALELLLHRKTNVELSKLCTLSELVARLTGQAIPPMKPIVGEDCFAHKLDLKVAPFLTGDVTDEPFDPALVGQTRTIKLGVGSGPAAVRYVGRELGLEVPDELIADLVQSVNEMAVEQKRCVTNDEFRELVGAGAAALTAAAAAG
jgi:isopropylmalate/homocitrate/citramalate synthase